MEMDAGQITDGASGGDCQMPEENVFSIGDVAREFGVSLRAPRFYEDRGLHPRRRGTTRLYSEGDRSRLQMILKGKRLGFTLTEIREILSSRTDIMNGGILSSICIPTRSRRRSAIWNASAPIWRRRSPSSKRRTSAPDALTTRSTPPEQCGFRPRRKYPKINGSVLIPSEPKWL